MGPGYFYLFAFLLISYAPPGKAQPSVLLLPGIEENSAAPAVKTDIVFGLNRFSNKPLFAEKDGVVTFFLRGRQQAGKVLLAGSFTDWQNKALLMSRTDSGWVADVKLQPGKHLYKFIIDNVWEKDTDNLLTGLDENGYLNSVYFRPTVTFILPSFLHAGNVFLLGSFNNWQAGELPMQKTATGWKLPLYLADGTYIYRFLVDGKAFTEPGNKKRFKDENGQSNAYLLVGKPNQLYTRFFSDAELAAVPSKSWLAALYHSMGNAYMQLNAYDVAQHIFQKAITLYEKEHYYDSTGAVYLKLEDISRYLGDFPAARKNIQKAILAFERAGNEKGLAEAFQDMGLHYLNLGKWSEAAIYFEKALALYQQQNNREKEGTALYQAGHAYLLVPDAAKSLASIQKALKLSEEINFRRGKAESLALLGEYYKVIKNDWLKAASYFGRALAIHEEIGNKGGIAEMNIAFADIYQFASDSVLQALHVPPSEKYPLAIPKIRKFYQLYSELKNIGRQHVAVRCLSDAFERAGQYDSAFYYFRQWVNMQNTFFNTEKEKQLVRLEMQFENRRKEDSLLLGKQLSDEKLQKQLLLAKQQEQQLSLQQNQIALATKEKDLQHLAYLKMLAELQNEQLEKQQKEKQLSLTEKEKQLQGAKVKALIQEQAISQLSRQRQWLFTLGGFAVLAFVSLFFINRSRLRSMRLQSQLAKEKTELEQKENAFQRQLADISLTALRSQMNPHFIFNCLNSIKLYTVENNTAAASDYVTKFSKLIRLVLENSRNERIPLSAELKALELYIQMESMRFKEKLHYTISLEDNVEADYIEIPPLLLQPYVENAIWHGLMHKEEGGQIEIGVACRDEESLLEITITDDGIGRQKATEIKSKTATSHRSYGMKATSDRIALINQIYKAGAGVTIRDLVDAAGEPAGTQVVIQIPV